MLGNNFTIINCFGLRKVTASLFSPSSLWQTSLTGPKIWAFFFPSSALSVQFSQSCLTFCDPMDCSTPGFPVRHYLLEFA